MVPEDDRAAAVRNDRLLLARILFGLLIVGVVGGVALDVLDAIRTGRPLFREGVLSDPGFLIIFGVFPVIGYIMAIRRPENSLGWLLLGIGITFGFATFVDGYAPYAIHGGFGGRQAGAVLAALAAPLWVPAVAVPTTFLILLFPDGHLPSPRWRWFARILAGGLVLICVLIILSPGPMTESGYPAIRNPLGLESLRSLLSIVTFLILLIPIGIVGSLVALALRFRRSTGIERLQLRWLVTAASIVAFLFTLTLFISWGREIALLQTIAVMSITLIPIAIGISVLRHRLFDIDIVIKRAVLFGALAIFITMVYVAIVVGVGALVGSRADPVLSAAAAAVVALAFQPVRQRARRVADRLVYGKRATPYEVLSDFSERVGQTYANDELLPRMAHVLGEGTGSARADVWVRVGNELRVEASWPEDAGTLPPREWSPILEGAVSSSSMFEPVRHRGEPLGALSIEKRPGESLTGTEEKLVQDLAAQAGLVMRNAGLTEDLLATIEQLRRSRQRLVAAQDEERRKLERNLHDGAQQQLVALTVKLRLLEQLIERDSTQARSMAAQLQGEATESLEELRDLARGIYPPLLADQGLVAALESQARKSVVPVTIEADGIRRYGRDAEAAVYFSCLEALQNVAKYAGATRATVTLSDGEGRLRFEVTDDGAGFEADGTSYGTGLQGIADRLAALDGEIDVRSTPGVGTTVAGVLPVRDQVR